MPIKGKILYPFRWWYRATISNSQPIAGTFEVQSKELVASVVHPLQPLTISASKKQLR